MRRRRVGSVAFQAGIFFPIVPVITRAPLPLAKPHHGKRAACQCGFSLVELMMVVGIILTIAAIAIPSFLQAREAARYAKAVGDINTLETDILTNVVTNGALPGALSDIGRGDLLDPWGNPYVYTNYANPATTSEIRTDRFSQPLNSDYDLFSAGMDGSWAPSISAAESNDDIVRANDGAYAGLVSQY